MMTKQVNGQNFQERRFDCVVLPENYTIELYDSYGDGWNGNVMTIGS